ncbi:MAG: hypothetical protein J6Q85_04960 [Clostridia bacterium]|nr:hypothetical protein [Clostridia bacterium]
MNNEYLYENLKDRKKSLFLIDTARAIEYNMYVFNLPHTVSHENPMRISFTKERC